MYQTVRSVFLGFYPGTGLNCRVEPEDEPGIDCSKWYAG